MTPMDNLDEALASLDPQLEGSYVFASVDSLAPGLEPFATVREPEGLTVVCTVLEAEQHGLDSSRRYARITARAQTALHAVGITSTVTSTVASRGIPCNVIAGVYHDHFFVPEDRAEETVALLQALSAQAAGWLPVK